MMPKAKNCLFLYLLIIAAIPLFCLFAQEQAQVRNPFLSMDERMQIIRAPLEPAKLPYPVVLKGIVLTDQVQMAVLNGEAVEAGQTWRDFKVEKIEKEKVILRQGGSRFEIPLILETKDEQKKD